MDFSKNKTYLMGILNVNEDSFFASSRCESFEKGVKKAKRLIKESADIIDIGGESSRPGSIGVSEEVEIDRVVPVVKEIRKFNKTILLSIDTVKPKVAKISLESGANLINDISGFRNEEMIDLARSFKCHLCVMHMQNTPKNMQERPFYGKGVVIEVIEFFQAQIDRLLEKGIEKEKIILDPGIGFGKTLEDNLEILRNIRSFKSLGYPVLVGISRKSFMGKILNKKPKDLLFSTLGINMLLIQENVDIIRVHDVKEHRDLIEMKKHI